MKNVLVTSLCLNAVLLGAVAFVAVRRPAPPTENQPSLIAELSGGKAQPAPTTRSRSAPASGGQGAFHWSQVESADFKQYMDNLRAIGCPEETIRDLVIAEIDKMFAARFTALAVETQKFEYWSRRSKARETLVTQIRALQDEKKALLRELLGIDADPYAKWVNVDFDRLREEGKYSFLTPDKQAQVRAIMEKYQQMETARAGGQGDLTGGFDSDSIKRLREQRQQEIAQVLSPEELKELSLRDSNTADSVRSRFGSMEITEAEYRKLYDLRKAYEDAQGAVADYSDPEKVRSRSEARRQLEEAYKTAFGEDRWNELQRQQDPTWRGLTQLAQQNNLSQSIVDQAWQYQRQTGEQVMQVLQDRSVPREQRDALVQQLTGEYDKALQNLLGDQAFQQYKQINPGFNFSSGNDNFSFVTGPEGTRRSISINGGAINSEMRLPAAPRPVPQ
jgi:hypothetical protein